MDYLPKFASCRDLGHKWDYFEWHGQRRILICDNCDARREETMDAFDIVKRRYTYPKGYSWQHTPLPVRELRRELRREASKLDRWRKQEPKYLVEKRAAAK